jgi:lipopolysaccharide transport system permease protein
MLLCAFSGRILYKEYEMIGLIKKLTSHRNLLKNLVLRDLKHRYVGSIGGILWSVIHPIVLLISYTFIYSILGAKLGPGAGTDSFAIFFMCGLLPWLLFTDTLMRNCNAITDNAPLITKTIIPAEILPISITISNLVHHLIALGILLAVLMVFNGLHLSAAYILLYMGLLLLFAQGLGLIMAGLHVFLRDTIQALQIILLLWFFFTPILYPLDRLPQNLQFVAGLNPMAIIVTGYRNSLLHLPQPGGAHIGILLAVSIAVFIGGALLFRQAKPAFPDVL